MKDMEKHCTSARQHSQRTHMGRTGPVPVVSPPLQPAPFVQFLSCAEQVECFRAWLASRFSPGLAASVASGSDRFVTRLEWREMINHLWLQGCRLEAWPCLSDKYGSAYRTMHETGIALGIPAR
jgi:hypothetical protein